MDARRQPSAPSPQAGGPRPINQRNRCRRINDLRPLFLAGDTFVDFLGGMKVRLTDHVVLSGAVTVPPINEGIRPAALGTIAGEMYF